ncbi:DUF2029 domain-containing protein, partial [Candidatus Sumerlaeota bacterium]|nr:DUF2029 domain-containing protein [Candidatus Sumerlaeota bacterium]
MSNVQSALGGLKSKVGMQPFGWVAVAALFVLFGYKQGYQALRGMHGNDFKHIYIGATLLPRGLNPYDENLFDQAARSLGFERINPYVYPPFTGLVLSFLRHWPPDDAAKVWFCLNHLMVIAALILCAHFLLGLRNPWPLALVALMAATSFPLRRTLTAGQLNCALLLIYSLLLAGEIRRRDWLSGLTVAFGTLFKLMPGIFIIYFLWKRRWRAVGWTALWLAALLAISVAIAGWDVHRAYLPVVREMGYGKSVWEQRLIAQGAEPFYRDPTNQSLNSLFHHLFAPDPLARITPWLALGGGAGHAAADTLTLLTSLALLFGALWAIGWRRQTSRSLNARDQPSRESLDVAAMILLSILIPSILWDHYLVVLFLPQIVLLAHVLARGQWRTWRMAALIAASALLAWPIAYPTIWTADG